MLKKSARKPLIVLVSADINALKQYHVYQNNVTALRSSGATAIVILPGESDVENIYKIADGVLLTGGSDIDPALYGGDANKKNIYGVSQQRDSTEIRLANLALKGKKPLLAICRGLQLVNVILGGSLYEDIDNIKFGDKHVIHRKSQTEPIEHEIKVTGGKIITQIVGKNSTISGYSQHHQAIKKLAPGLEVVGYAADNLIECCELAGHNWFLGTQWHPEFSFETDKIQQKIFDVFVKEAENVMLNET